MARPKQMTKLIHVRLSQELLDAIDRLVKTGKYANRSEFIRAAIREQLKRDLGEAGSESRGNTNS